MLWIYILPTGAALGVSYWIWRKMPVGQLHGQTIRLHEWWQWRPNLKIERIRRKLSKIVSLPVEDRFRPLVKLYEKVDPDDFVCGREVEVAVFAMGREELIGLMEIALWNERRPRISNVTSGVREALVSKAATAEYRQRAYDVLTRKFRELTDPGTKNELSGEVDLARAILDLDPQRGVEEIYGRLNPESSTFSALLDLLNEKGRSPPAEWLRTWLKNSATQPSSYKEGMRLVAILLALGQHRPAEVEPALRSIVESTIEEVATKAAEALLELRDLPHPRGSLVDRSEDNGPESLNRHELTAHLADMFGYYVGNRFYDSLLEEFGHLLPRMAEALTCVGAIRGAELISKIVAELPPAGLPGDKQGRYAAVRELPVEVRQAIVRLVNAHYFSDGDPCLLSMKYILANESGFRPA